MSVKRISRNNSSISDIFCKLAILFHNPAINRKVILITSRFQPHKLISCLFQFRRNNFFFYCHIYSKRNQSRRNIYILKCSGHTVFSSDRRKSESDLCRISSKKRCKRLAPTFWIFWHSSEIFLKRKSDLTVISTCRNYLGNRFNNRVSCAMIRTPTWKIRVKSITHHRHTVSCSVLHGNLCYHGLCLCHLIFSTVRHKDRACADWTVKHLNKSFLRADIQIA